MKRRKSRDAKIEVPTVKARNFNPHARDRVIPNKHKLYTRKARNRQGSEPSDFLGRGCWGDDLGAPAGIEPASAIQLRFAA